MNHVLLTGRLIRNPDVTRGKSGHIPIARFSIAIDRGGDLGTDYPVVVCFGKTAELAEKCMTKGKLIGVSGRIQTGSYEKNGRKVYTTDVIADSVELLDRMAFSGLSER